MTNENAKTATTKAVNVFETAMASVVLKPKTIPEQGFIYRSLSDLENLIGFVGVAPKVNVEKGKMIISFGKAIIPEGSLVFRTIYGTVSHVMSLDKANEVYEIAAQSEFKPEHKNKVQDKPARVKK